MTPNQALLVKNSFRMLAPRRRLLAPVFFDALLAREPSLRPLFGPNLAAEGEALFDGLAGIITSLGRIYPVVPALEWLAQRNACRGLGARHYESFGAALLETLEMGHGEAFTPELRAAWTAAQQLVIRIMLSSVEAEPLAA